MSLRDTIKGAAEEAQETVASVASKKSQKESEKGGGQTVKYAPRKSAASAKPSREAAASVRISSASGSKSAKGGTPTTKEQKRAARQRERAHDDFRNRGFEILLRNDPEYHRVERIWWVILGVGFAATIVTFVLTTAFPEARNLGSGVGLVSAIALIIAYVFIFGSVIFSFVKLRPIRKRVERQVVGMTDKKLGEKVAACEAAKEAKKAEKKARKAENK